jgi:DNA-binding MarR family transcriptional regulator
MFTFAEEQGLTRVQLFALYSIDKHGALGMSQIAGVLHCDASNVTGIVDRLVAQGLVTRKESERDRRTKMLQLTDKGRELAEKLKALMPVKMGCDLLTEQERTVLHTVAQKFAR